MGLATRKADLNRVRGGQEAESWCLGSDHAILHNGCELHTIAPADTSITTHPLVDATSTADASLNETATAGSTTTANLVDNSDVERLVDDTSDDASLAIVKTQPPAAQHHHSLPEALSLLPAEGDTIGVAYDHVELNFYLNGRKLDVPVLNVRGTVFPALYGKCFCFANPVILLLYILRYLLVPTLFAVDEGAVLDLITNNFNYAPPPGFDRIMIEQSLL